jgi:hypothetical protein
MHLVQMLPASITPPRRVLPSSRDWTPEEYQLRGVDHLVGRLSGGLALDPGLGKTAITLGAFSTLLKAGEVRRMLVIAPLRVCRQVWQQEGRKWTQFNDLRFVHLHGPKKDKILRDSLKGTDADPHIYLINPSAVAWLCSKYSGRQLPFDIVCIDELTRFKNSGSERSKALRPRIAGTRFKWGLTGSLLPNGFMDLFGQMLILDGGAALGRFITHYRDQYFTVAYDGYTYNLMPNAADRILSKIAPYWLQLTAEDYIKLPPLVDMPHMLKLEPPERYLYNAMRDAMVANLPGGIITASNTAAAYAKMAQMANGAVYNEEGEVQHIHDVKLDALEELIEELNGQPLLIAYEFNHDLERIRERFKGRFHDGVVPYLGNGTTPAQETQWLAQWNKGELPFMAVHPASAGHGLNMQEGHAAHIAWFSVSWDFELYDQLIRRLRRRGNEAQRIFNHLLLVENTLDELKLQAVQGKDMTQRAAMVALNAEIQRESLIATGGLSPAHQEPTKMGMKLSNGPAASHNAAVTPAGWADQQAPAQHAPAAPPAQHTAQHAPSGWGGAVHAQPAPHTQGNVVTPAGWNAPANGPAPAQHVQHEAPAQAAAPAGWPQPAMAPGNAPAPEAAQRAAIQEHIAPREPALSAFSSGVSAASAAVAGGDYGQVAPATQTPVEQLPAQAVPAFSVPQTTTVADGPNKPSRAPRSRSTGPAPAPQSASDHDPIRVSTRMQVLMAVLQHCETSGHEELVSLCDKLAAWIHG